MKFPIKGFLPFYHCKKLCKKITYHIVRSKIQLAKRILESETFSNQVLFYGSFHSLYNYIHFPPLQESLISKHKSSHPSKKTQEHYPTLPDMEDIFKSSLAGSVIRKGDHLNYRSMTFGNQVNERPHSGCFQNLKKVVTILLHQDSYLNARI